MEDYPASWEPLTLPNAKNCPDIKGKYYSSYGLLNIIKKIKNGDVITAVDVDIIEFTQISERTLLIKGYKNSDFAFSKEATFGCKPQFISIILEMDYAVGLYVTGYGSETVHFGMTRSHQLVAELSSQAAALIGLILPVIGGENQWFKFQPVETENITDPDALFVLGKESPFKSRRQFIWFCRAAHNGHAVARFLLASRFYDLKEIEKPPRRKHAYLWYSLAAKAGDDHASHRLNELEKSMTPAELYDADKLLSGWTPDPSDCAEEAGRLQLS